jgi:hypothetical protein
LILVKSAATGISPDNKIDSTGQKAAFTNISASEAWGYKSRAGSRRRLNFGLPGRALLYNNFNFWLNEMER